MNPSDEHHLRHALELAREGLGLASPNPYVGAILVDPQGNIIGAGTYTYHGVKHAEILALEEAGVKARGATLYINLEPHAHQGRTPPCTAALIAAGIARVVASMPDPNPKVSGRGFAQLRAAGAQVEVGGLEAEARRLNESFARYIRHGVPFVTLKSAMTLNGKIAPPPNSQSRAAGAFTGTWITDEPARAYAHELRHQHDAILVGIGTILADNPLLTDRSGRPRRRPLLRVVLDSHLRLPLDSRIARSAADASLLVFYSRADDKTIRLFADHGIHAEKLPSTPDGRIDLAHALRRLAELEIISVMIEGGSSINAAALSANIVDKMFFFYAPTILGAPGSIPFATGNSIPTTRLSQINFHRFGDDVAIEGYLRDPYQD